jgi:hypothetical protein
MIFPEQSISRKIRFFHFIPLGIDCIMISGSGICFFQICLVKCGILQIAFLKNSTG